jgi:cell division protein FtsZ
MIESEADDNADIIWGSVIKEELRDEIRITVIATGFDTHAAMQIPKPKAEAAHAVSQPPVQYASNDLPPVDNIDVPTFMRRHAD